MTAVLYFDGQCPICAKEMKLLNRWKSDGLALVDVHSADLSETLKAQRLQILYLELGDGKALQGVDASVAAWSYTPFGWLLSPLRWFWLKPLVDVIYQRWAARRYQRLYACAVANEKESRIG